MDDYSFYHDRMHGYLVRRTGGFTSKQYRMDERYTGTRAASSEFATVSRAGKLIRDAFSPFIDQVKDGTMVNRLNKELVALKQLDAIHEKGNRRPETMMADAEANKWLRIFQFNDGVKVYDLLRKTKQEKATLCISPQVFPAGATHAGLTLVRTVIDFEKGCYETYSSRMALVSRDAPKEVTLTIHATHQLKGRVIEFCCLQVLFFEEVNNDLVQLKGKIHAMGVLEIANRVLL